MSEVTQNLMKAKADLEEIKKIIDNNANVPYVRNLADAVILEIDLALEELSNQDKAKCDPAAGALMEGGEKQE